LVSGVRELASIDAQLAHEPVAVVDLHAMLREIVERLRLSAGASIVLHVHGPDDAHRVRASDDRLAQVFDNLLQNARSFTPADGAIEITLATTNGQCSIAVAD